MNFLGSFLIQQTLLKSKKVLVNPTNLCNNTPVMKNDTTYATAVSIMFKATKGKFAQVVYQKKDGTTSKYTVRTGVKKYVTGVGKHPVPNSVTVYSVTAGNTGYKTFILDGVKSFKCGNLRFGQVAV